ncbi:7-cyano-7-deazaguanine synthase [Patescibacteria group bacterium]|nr:7-cyano-7-deazaguanine synthase [Patescibacteria group bacterium]
MNDLPRLNKKLIITILKSRKLENMKLISYVEDFFRKERGYIFKMPNQGEQVILLFSGGLDTSIVAAILMEIYKLEIYPVFTRRGHPYQHAEEKAADYFTKFFQNRYPGQFHDLIKINTSFPPTEIRWAYEKVENKPINKNSNQLWGDYFYSNLLVTFGAQCAYFLQIIKNFKIRTIFTAYMKSDGEGKLDMTLTTMRGIMLGVCLVTHDMNWQITSLPLEKEIGFFYDKDYFIKWATKHNIPLEKTRSSCRAKSDQHCGRCLICYIRQKSFKNAGIQDKTNYLNTSRLHRLRKITKIFIPNNKLRQIIKNSIGMK